MNTLNSILREQIKNFHPKIKKEFEDFVRDDFATFQHLLHFQRGYLYSNNLELVAQSKMKLNDLVSMYDWELDCFPKEALDKLTFVIADNRI
jgi:hypothetical protein